METSSGGCQSATSGGATSSISGFLMRSSTWSRRMWCPRVQAEVVAGEGEPEVEEEEGEHLEEEEVHREEEVEEVVAEGVEAVVDEVEEEEEGVVCKPRTKKQTPVEYGHFAINH
jgi:hypothetical protein